LNYHVAEVKDEATQSSSFYIQPIDKTQVWMWGILQSKQTAHFFSTFCSYSFYSLKIGIR